MTPEQQLRQKHGREKVQMQPNIFPQQNEQQQRQAPLQQQAQYQQTEHQARLQQQCQLRGKHDASTAAATTRAAAITAQCAETANASSSTSSASATSPSAVAGRERACAHEVRLPPGLSGNGRPASATQTVLPQQQQLDACLLQTTARVPGTSVLSNPAVGTGIPDGQQKTHVRARSAQQSALL